MPTREPLRFRLASLAADLWSVYPATIMLIGALLIILLVVTVIFWSVAWIIWLCILGVLAFIGVVALFLTALDEW